MDLPFAKSVGKNIGKNISKNLSGKYNKKFFDHANNLKQMPLKLLRKKQFKSAEATGDLIGNKISNKITKVSKNSQQINSETVTNDHDKETPKE